MVKQNLEILEFEDKKTKAGKRYTRFKTSDGWMSCFDRTSCDSLKDLEGSSALVEVSQEGDFKNIKKYLGKATEEDSQEKKSAKFEGEKPVNLKESFPVSMKVSYAKDLICQKGMEADKAVEVVKYLIKAFESAPVVKEKPVVVEHEEEDFIEVEHFD
jgi:hypothetical protein